VLDSSGRLLVGTSTADSYYSAYTPSNAFTPKVQIKGSYSADLAVNCTNDGALLHLANSSVITSGRLLGGISFSGFDGTDLRPGAGILAYTDATTGSSDMPGSLRFLTTADGASSPTERMRITQAGNVSFNGTDSTTANGGVGNVYKFFAGSANPILAFETTGTSANACLEFRRAGRSGSARASQVSIGENSSNQGQVDVYSSAANADVSGGVRLVNGATSWSSISDIRLKNIISSFDNALSDVSTLEAFRFTWKNDETETPQIGLSAQSVQTVLPEAISSGKPVNAPEDDDTEYLSVRYTEVIPLLVAALQESKERIETLEAKVAALEAQ
jgi:hypothetical protein